MTTACPKCGGESTVITALGVTVGATNGVCEGYQEPDKYEREDCGCIRRNGDIVVWCGTWERDFLRLLAGQGVPA
jgi:ribosomal protein L36